MRGKVVNLLAATMNILFGILMLVYSMYIPQEIIELTVQELSITKVLLKVIYVILTIVVLIDILQYHNHRDNSRIKTGYLLGIFAISFIFIKESVISCLSIISGIIIIINALKDNVIDIDSTTGISIIALVMVATVICCVISVFYKNLGTYVKEKENEDNLEYKSDYFKYITELDISDVYINMKKNGKYGYINQNGEIKIDFIYDYASPFITITAYNKEFQVALVCQDDVSYLILKNQRKILSYHSESAVDNYEAKIQELSNIYKNILGQGGEMQTEIIQKLDNMDKAPIYEEVATDYTYRYDYNDEYDIIITQSNLGLGDKFELAKKDNLNIKMNLDCQNIDYDENCVYLYSNHTIPFFNVSNREQGWFTSYGKKNTMTGKAQILDFIDDKILIRNYNNKTLYFIDSKGEILSDVYKDIYICEDRYIVKNSNDKYIIIDKEFHKVFDREFDIIDPSLVSVGIYICANSDKAIEFNHYNFAEMNFEIISYDGTTIIDGISQIYQKYYKIENNKDVPYVTRYEEFLENAKDIEFNFVGDKFYEIF